MYPYIYRNCNLEPQTESLTELVTNEEVIAYTSVTTRYCDNALHQILSNTINNGLPELK